MQNEENQETIDIQQDSQVEPKLELESNTEQTDLSDNDGPSNTEDAQPEQIDPEANDYEKELKGLQKTKPKALKILIGVISFLLVVLLILVGLYFGGFFSKKEDEKNATKKPAHATHEVNVTKKPPYKFHAEDINHERLNHKLSFLTKHELNPSDLNKSLSQDDANTTIYDKETAYLSSLEEKVIDANSSKEQNQTTIVDTKKSTAQTVNEKNKPKEITHKEQSQKQPGNTKNTQKNEQPKIEKHKAEKTKKPKEQTKTNKAPQKQVNPNKKQKYIQVVTLQYAMYKGFLDKVKEVDARISVCKDAQGRTQVFMGPFANDINRKEVIKQINGSLVKDAFGVEFSQVELEKRCNF